MTNKNATVLLLQHIINCQECHCLHDSINSHPCKSCRCTWDASNW